MVYPVIHILIYFQLNKSLEGCIASVNAGLLKHKLLLGVDDRGKLSCHKVIFLLGVDARGKLPCHKVISLLGVDDWGKLSCHKVIFLLGV